jgi:hypothetical protein
MRILALLGFSTVLFGGDLSGIWVGQIVAGRFGELQDVAFKFTQNGATLTGKMYGENESQIISEGKIEGDQITFRISNEMNGGQSRFLFTGMRKGDEIQLIRQRELPPGDTNDNPNRRNLRQNFNLKRLL